MRNPYVQFYTDFSGLPSSSNVCVRLYSEAIVEENIESIDAKDRGGIVQRRERFLGKKRKKISCSKRVCALVYQLKSRNLFSVRKVRQSGVKVSRFSQLREWAMQVYRLILFLLFLLCFFLVRSRLENLERRHARKICFLKK